MYAIVSTGGKQYKAEVGDIIKVEKLEGDVGDKLKLDVIMVSDEGKVVCGNPIKDASAEAEVVAQGKNKKIVVFKYKAKKNVRKRQGHRQPFTSLKITAINA